MWRIFHYLFGRNYVKFNGKYVRRLFQDLSTNQPYVAEGRTRYYLNPDASVSRSSDAHNKTEDYWEPLSFELKDFYSETKNEGELVCNFCLKPKNEVEYLVKGANGYICSKCVEGSMAVIAKHHRT